MRRILILTLTVLLSLGCGANSSRKLSQAKPSKASQLLAEATKKHEARDYLGAQMLLQAALKEDPNLAPAYALLAREALAEGRLSEADELFRKTLSLDAQSADAALGLGTVLAQQGKASEAETFLLQARTVAPKSSKVAYALAMLYVENALEEKAKPLFADAIALDPSDPWPRIGLARIVQKNSPEESLKLLGEAQTAAPMLDEVHHWKGMFAAEKKDYAAAEAEFRLATEKNPNASKNWMNLGTVQSWQGKSEDAAASFRKAIELQKEYALAYNNLALLLLPMGSPEEAMKAIEQAITLAPKIPLYQANKGDLLLSQGKFADAAVAYAAALTLLGEQPDAEAPLRRKLALSLVESGNAAKAYETLAEFCKKYPANTATLALKEEAERIARKELATQLR